MFGATTRNIAPICIDENYSNPREYVESMIKRVEEIRAQYIKRKARKARSNLHYLNKTRRGRTFAEGDVVLYKNVHLQKSSSTSKILYKPAIITEILPSKVHANIQSLVTSKILKYSFLYLKKINKMSQVSEIPLPMEWQRRLIEAIRRKDEHDEEEESLIETSSDDIDEMDETSDLGFGDSQESIQRSQEDSDNDEVNDE